MGVCSYYDGLLVCLGIHHEWALCICTGGCEEGRGGGKILAKAEIDLGLKVTTYDPEHDQTLDSAK